MEIDPGVIIEFIANNKYVLAAFVPFAIAVAVIKLRG